MDDDGTFQRNASFAIVDNDDDDDDDVFLEDLRPEVVGFLSQKLNRSTSIKRYKKKDASTLDKNKTALTDKKYLSGTISGMLLIL